MKRAGIFSVLMLAIAVAGCNNGGGGNGDSNSGVVGSYYTQYNNDKSNMWVWGDVGILVTDLAADGNKIRFSGIGLGFEAEREGDTFKGGYENDDVKYVYQLSFGKAADGSLALRSDKTVWDEEAQEGDGLVITFKNWTCVDENGAETTCYSRYLVNGPQVFDEQVNPMIALAEESENSATSSGYSMKETILEGELYLGAKGKEVQKAKLRELIQKFENR